MKKKYICPDILVLDMSSDEDLLTVSATNSEGLNNQSGSDPEGGEEMSGIKVIQFDHADYDNW